MPTHFKSDDSLIDYLHYDDGDGGRFGAQYDCLSSVQQHRAVGIFGRRLYTPDIGGKRNFPGRPDDRPADASPIGEPWLLLAFALLFGGWKMLIDGVLYIVRDDKIYDCRGVLVH